jgi:hyperosmotically inducible periplasmic protein
MTERLYLTIKCFNLFTSRKKEIVMLNVRKVMGLGFVLIIIIAMLGCRTPAGRTPGEYVDDSGITTRVKSALLADDSVSGFAIGVRTFEGEVHLTGAVDSPEQKQRAEELAARVDGVRKVNNQIIVR